MSRRRSEQPADVAAMTADDALLDALVYGEDAVSWDLLDPAAEVLAALRADVTAALPPVTVPAAASATVNLNQRPRLRNAGKRTAVASAVTAAVLSVSGVAAAGIAVTPTGPLGPIHRFFVDVQPTPSEHAVKQVRLFLRLAEADLDANRLTAASEALAHASAWITRVAGDDLGDLPTQLSVLQRRYDALKAADDQSTASSGNSGGEHGQSGKQDDHGPDVKGKSHEGSGNSGDHGSSGSHEGSGSGGSGGHGDGRDDSGSASTGGDKSGSGSTDSGSHDSGSSGDGSG